MSMTLLDLLVTSAIRNYDTTVENLFHLLSDAIAWDMSGTISYQFQRKMNFSKFQFQQKQKSVEF